MRPWEPDGAQHEHTARLSVCTGPEQLLLVTASEDSGRSREDSRGGGSESSQTSSGATAACHVSGNSGDSSGDGSSSIQPTLEQLLAMLAVDTAGSSTALTCGRYYTPAERKASVSRDDCKQPQPLRVCGHQVVLSNSQHSTAISTVTATTTAAAVSAADTMTIFPAHYHQPGILASGGRR
eukprot:scpid92004/ scgid24692/ 